MTNRTALCSYCKTERPSDPAELAFFQDKSKPQPGCAAPGQNAKGECGYYLAAHVYDASRVQPEPRMGHEFVPQTAGEPHDEYYCGCRGWD